MKSIYLLSVLIFLSCQQPVDNKSDSSIVGNWENSQMEKCKKKVKSIANHPGMTIMLKDYNKSVEQFCECYCEEIEKTYKSFDESLEKMTNEQEHSKLQKYCITGTDNFKK